MTSLFPQVRLYLDTYDVRVKFLSSHRVLSIARVYHSGSAHSSDV